MPFAPNQVVVRDFFGRFFFLVAHHFSDALIVQRTSSSTLDPVIKQIFPSLLDIGHVFELGGLTLLFDKGGFVLEAQFVFVDCSSLGY